MGAKPVHVRSGTVMSDYFLSSFRIDDYEQHVDGSRCGEAEKVLRRSGVSAVVAGSESGVVLADRLNAALGSPGNDPSRAGSRRDKAQMASLVAGAGLRTPVTGEFVSASAAAAWAESLGVPELVVKPVSSAGSDNVRFCTGTSEVEAAAAEVLSATTIYGEPNDRVLVQERLIGPEFYFNTVSAAGIHKVAEAWRYVKREGPTGGPVYDYEMPIDPTDSCGRVLRSFVFSVLDALGILNGAAHTEVILTEQGPALVESGARLGGATLPDVVERLLGVSQTGLLARSLIDAACVDDFDERAHVPTTFVRNVSLLNHRAGIVAPGWPDLIGSLPSVVEVVAGARPGDFIAETTDLLSAPGFVFMASPDEEAIARDYECLRELERCGIYTGLGIEAEASSAA